MKRQLSIWIMLLMISLFGIPGCGNSGNTKSQDHDNGIHGKQHSGDSHNENAADEHDEHNEHGEEVIRLTPKQLQEAGVEIQPLRGGMITTHVTLPAEVGLNMDNVVHVTPRVPGIVSEVRVFLGDQVNSGTVLAVIESPELGEAKIAYLQAIQAQFIADAALKRQRTISENTAKLLDLLRKEPELESLRLATADLRIGVNKGRLLSAYAKMKAAEANYARERELRSKNLSTESDLLAAQEAFNSSMADYLAVFEDIDFTYRLKLLEAERSAGIAASEVENAERRLHLYGLSEEQVVDIPNEPDINLARYALYAPSAGQIVEKHITAGEKVLDDESVYTIADMNTVWLNISVYTEYVGQIHEGQHVVIHADGRRADGIVDYVSALVSESTRTLTARVVVDNADHAWKPGEFVTARVEIGSEQVSRTVPVEAIQTYEGHDVVFIQDEEGIKPVPIEIGLRNDESVEILGDEIALGTPIVVKNSFLMKAELGKSAAGHEH